LSYGARPDARDVCGKTVCHYGAGAMATDMTLAVVERAAAAYETSHLFGRQVELTGLRGNPAMNGKRGIARGYHSTSKRRAVYLFADTKQIAVKPENLKLVVEGDGAGEEDADAAIRNGKRNLCNLQCRLGTVSLHETIPCDRKDVAEFLIYKLGADIDIADCDGTTARSMAMIGGSEMISRAASVIKDTAARQGRAANKDDRRKCANCEKPEPVGTKFEFCSRCKQVRYCGRSCQGRCARSQFA